MLTIDWQSQSALGENYVCIRWELLSLQSLVCGISSRKEVLFLSWHSKNEVTPWHSNCLTKFNAIIIICFSTFSHHFDLITESPDKTTEPAASSTNWTSHWLNCFYKNAVERHLFSASLSLSRYASTRYKITTLLLWSAVVLFVDCRTEPMTECPRTSVLTFINIYHIDFHLFYLSAMAMKFRLVNFLLNDYWIGLEWKPSSGKGHIDAMN